MIKRYVIGVVQRFEQEAEFVKEFIGKDEGACLCALKIFHEQGAYKVFVVDEDFRVIFKNTRRCKCTNVQGDFITGVNKCMDCGLEVNKDAWMGEKPMDILPGREVVSA